MARLCPRRALSTFFGGHPEGEWWTEGALWSGGLFRPDGKAKGEERQCSTIATDGGESWFFRAISLSSTAVPGIEENLMRFVARQRAVEFLTCVRSTIIERALSLRSAHRLPPGSAFS